MRKMRHNWTNDSTYLVVNYMCGSLVDRWCDRLAKIRSEDGLLVDLAGEIKESAIVPQCSYKAGIDYTLGDLICRDRGQFDFEVDQVNWYEIAEWVALKLGEREYFAKEVL